MKKIISTLLLLTLFSCYAEEPNLELVISSKEISEKIQAVGRQINLDYADKDLTVVIVI